MNCCDVHFNRQGGRRVDVEVDFVFFADEGFMLDVIALIRFQPLGGALLLPGRHAERFVGDAQFLGESRDEQAEQLGRLLVPLRKPDDLQRSRVESHANATVADDSIRSIDS